MGWELYYADGKEVLWKSGSTGGYGAFVAFDGSTGRAAVALSSCSICAEKAIDQVARLLVEPPAPVPPPRPLPMAPPHSVPGMLALQRREELAKYVGTYTLPAMANANRQPARNSSLLNVTFHSGAGGVLAVAVGDAGGSATLVPYTGPSPRPPMVMPLSFMFGDDTTVCMRPKGCGPMEVYNSQHGPQHLYFTNKKGTGHAHADTAVLHIDGWDIFANRLKSQGPPAEGVA